MILRILIYALAALIVAAAIITTIGYMLPQGHVASREAVVDAPRETVFARISDPAGYPAWRPDVSSVEVLSRDPLRWREQTGGDAITYEVVEQQPPDRLVVRIADPDLPFGGTWTYELRPEGKGTRIVITERGEVYNPFFRFMSRFVFSPTATMEGMLRAMGGTALTGPRD